MVFNNNKPIVIVEMFSFKTGNKKTIAIKKGNTLKEIFSNIIFVSNKKCKFN